MRRQQESHKYWDQVTLENAMQMANFKNFTFRRNELYSKVRPPVSKCHPEITAEYLMDAINNYGYRAVVNKLNRMRAETIENNSTDSGSSKLKTLHSLKKSKPMQDKNNTPREVKRMLNSRPANFQQWEKPPSALMTPVLKGVSMVSIDENDTEKRSGFGKAQDDVVEVWRRCPNKDTLGYYGVDTGINKSEAVVFNQAIEKCLKKVKPPEAKAKPLKTPAASSVPATPRHQHPFVLNRSQLKAKVDNMASLKVTKAISWLNCRRSLAMAQPFFQSETQIGQKRVMKATQLRRRQKQQKSELLNYECMEPKKVSAYELAYQREMEKLEQEIESEPKDYDELFSNLITCFQRSSQRDSVYDAFKRCKGSSQHNFVPDFSGTNESGGGGDTASGGAQTGLSTEGSTLRRALVAASERDEARRNLLKYASPKPINTKKGAAMRGSRGASEGAEDAGSGNRAGRGGDVSSGSRGGRGKRLSKTSSSYRKSRARPDVTRASNKKPQMPQQGRFDDKFRKKEHSFIISSSTSRSILTNYYGDNSKDDKSSAKTRTLKNKKNNNKAKKEWNAHLSRCPKTLCVRDCNCEVCNFMERRDREPDSPLISKMKEEEKRRKLREYYKSMRYKEQMASAPQEYRPLYNQHKCEPIREENCFCTSRKWGECLDRLDALQELQKSYGHMDKDLLHKVKVLKDRLCWQICEGLQLQRKLGAVRY